MGLAMTTLTKWRLKRRQWKNVGLLPQNMKPYIFHNGCKNILNDIMGCDLLSPPWAQQKRWIPMGFNDWLKMQCVGLRTRGWGRPNLISNIKGKILKGRQKHEITEWAHNKVFELGLAHDLKRAWCESKDMLKRYWKRNGHAIFLK